MPFTARKTAASIAKAVWLCAVVLAGLSLPSVALAEDSATKAESIEAGELLVRRHCSRCHTVGGEGPSPNATAPAFRDLSERYPVTSLEEALGEGIVTGHPEMPEFYFQPEEVDQIIAYLQSIQKR